MNKIIDNFGVRFLLSSKNMLTTRAYYSSAVNTLSNELSIDTPYSIIVTIRDTTNVMQCNSVSSWIMTENFQHIIHNFDNLLFLSSIIILCIGIDRADYKSDSIVNKLYGFIDYNTIQKQTKTVIFVIIFIFFKNVSNAV